MHRGLASEAGCHTSDMLPNEALKKKEIKEVAKQYLSHCASIVPEGSDALLIRVFYSSIALSLHSLSHLS